MIELSSVALRMAERSWSSRDRLVLEERDHDLLVVVGHGLDQVVPVRLGLLAKLGGHLVLVPLGTERVDVADALHRDEVDVAVEAVLGADRDLERHGAGAQALDHRLHGVEEVGARAVHLVDERDPGDAVLVGLAPHRLGLGLDAGDRVEERHGAVEDAQAALDLDRKVHVPGRVENVDAVVTPEAGRRGGRDRDAALLLLDHPVHGGRALVDLAHLVGAAGVVEDALGRRGLARVDMGHDPDVADPVELLHAGHASARSCLGDCHCLCALYHR